MKSSSQSGFIMMMLLVIMVVGAGVYFSKFAENKLFQGQSAQVKAELAELEDIKQRLLLYAVLHPEIYATDASVSYIYYEAYRVPGPGYFPCPDTDGNGVVESSCSASAGSFFVEGYLAPIIKSRNFFFTTSHQSQQYHFVVLEQMVHQNPNYTNTINGTNLNRFAPLNSSFASANLLSLNGRANYAVLIFPKNSEPFSNGINGAYVQPRNPEVSDLIVGITLPEWRNTVRLRVESQGNLFCNDLDENERHWFNEYRPNTDPNPNPVGSSWRGVLPC